MATPSGNMLMALTTLGLTRIAQIGANGLVFRVAEVAYGTGGFGPPETATALNPAAVALTAEVFRKPVARTTLDTIEVPRGRETTFTTVGGGEFTAILGEAGVFAEITDPGTTGLSVGDKFLLAHAHFPRLCFSSHDRLAIEWPIDYSPGGAATIYNNPGSAYNDALLTYNNP